MHLSMAANVTVAMEMMLRSALRRTMVSTVIQEKFCQKLVHERLPAYNVFVLVVHSFVLSILSNMQHRMLGLLLPQDAVLVMKQIEAELTTMLP